MHKAQGMAGSDGGGFLPALETADGEILFDCDSQQIQHRLDGEQVADRAGWRIGCAGWRGGDMLSDSYD